MLNTVNFKYSNKVHYIHPPKMILEGKESESDDGANTLKMYH